MLTNRKVVVGVTGGIAAYKAAELVRQLARLGASIRVIMTPAAMEFITPLTFETLTGHPVLTGLFPHEQGGGTVHIEWARWAECLVICPATANTIARAAHGFADNALTTTLLATTAPILFCPAMNRQMYANPLYQQNEKRLLEHGWSVVAPGSGELACGEVGEGRLSEIPEIVEAVRRLLSRKHDYQGRRVLVTAGPTHEPLDPVRYLGNRSTGKMGYALAEMAALRGAGVTLVTGPSHERPFSGIKVVRVTTAAEMSEAVQHHLPDCDLLFMAAAVSDYRPAAVAAQKIKKGEEEIILPLTRTEDILRSAGLSKGGRTHVGFSVETGEEIPASLRKLEEKNLDMIVVNNPLEPGAGFAVDTNIITLLRRGRDPEKWPQMSKQEVADRLLTAVLEWEKEKSL
ncbi:MAG TPA: bifunctional phosphopantothenoylcysteine decarboxylase/phosphopantothenate--cysteine ligase CoaBC [bacterium]|mgnify:FL=1|nr:bifunctional phosphopantothenoylcysteine decarboxylase/phosphopantothenate--cysteine ligase CoaBC [bacterium]HOY43985.1 bifunctional phosphopantothenoylcysteine decarboxylase/phosphopantothenate--cysteine ligase CoaBC [bacterium]HPG83566.1 bifunctional phosphopantothenoylcysteine decarboxylase/phosphopantothenate--cysteine ligase CoaBC [bacterium]HPM59316.1 bifunctional phosphopantothenoylcysteine decarboxylase/phosphopantothenate--cysteine ligase CoaBC [bacterium]